MNDKMSKRDVADAVTRGIVRAVILVIGIPLLIFLVLVLVNQLHGSGVL